MIDSFDEKAKSWDMELYRRDRAKTIAREIANKTQLGKRTIAMEFGCGTGLLGFELQDLVGEITFADTSSGMLEQVEAKIKTGNIRNARLLNLRTEPIDRTYNLIFSLLVLHHIDDYAAQISALIAALAPEGVLCLIDLDEEDGSFHAPERVPHNGFNRDEIASLLVKNGMTRVDACTAYINRKIVGSAEKEFPLFMVTGKRQ